MRLTRKGPLSEALGQLEWQVEPRGLHWSPQVPQTPSQPCVPPPGQAPAAAALAADTVGHQASQSCPPLLEAPEVRAPQSGGFQIQDPELR